VADFKSLCAKVNRMGNKFSRDLTELKQNCRFFDVPEILRAERETENKAWTL
jgi:hypothetical protein